MTEQSRIKRIEKACAKQGIEEDSPLAEIVMTFATVGEDMIAEGRQIRAAAEGIGKVAAQAAGEAATQVVERKLDAGFSARNWRTTAIMVAALAGTGVSCLLIGIGLGAGRPVASPVGPISREAAAVFAMNDVSAYLEACRGIDRWTDPRTGREVCNLRVYTTPGAAPGARP